MSAAAGGRNHSLDTLRAVAILMVLVHHTQMAAPISPLVAEVVRLGERGVDLFFVLSGYLVGGIALREFKVSNRIDLGRFWRQRWFRTLPAYYVTLLLYAAKELVPHRSPGLVSILPYPFFLQVYVLGPLPDFAHSWSLCVEEHFYLALPLVLLACGRFEATRGPRVTGFIALVGVGFLLTRWAWGPTAYEQLSHWRTDGLVAGVLLAALDIWWDLRGLLARRLPWLWAAAASATAAWVAAEVFGLRTWQTFAALASLCWVALAVTRASALERAGRNPGVAWLSRVSYSLYLLHPLVGGALELVWYAHTDRGLAASMGFGLGMLSLSLVVAEISYRWVESPALRLRDRWASRGALRTGGSRSPLS